MTTQNQGLPAATQENTLAKIQSRIKLVGDLPIFSASINRLRRISADPDSDAMALAKEIMKDANFSAKVLRLANSPYYNRGRGKIGVISRAVVVLGFDTLKNITLTLKLIESFQHRHPAIDMNAMLVRAYLSAGFVQMLSLKCGVKDVEESYTCALLHQLGEVAVAYFLPDEYTQIQKLSESADTPAADIPQRVLGTGYAQLGQLLAADWGFPSTVVHSMGSYDPEVDGKARGKVQVNRAMASLANRIVGSIYRLEDDAGERPIGTLFNDLASLTGIEFSVVQNCLSDSFNQSCKLAREYGLDGSMLMPQVKETGDSLCDTLARQFAYYASELAPAGDETSALASDDRPAAPRTPASAKTAPAAASAARDKGEEAQAPSSPSGGDGAAPVPGADPNRQLLLLQEITTLIADSASLNLIFSKVVEGIRHGVGFDNVVLCLVNRDRTAFGARVALGAGAPALKEYFQCPISNQRDLFSLILQEGGDVLVDDSTNNHWKGMLPEDYAAQVGAASFALAPLRLDTRPVGLFYADKSVSGLSITQEEYRGFIHFVSQARLALKMSG